MLPEFAATARLGASGAVRLPSDELHQLRSEVEWLRQERARYRAVSELTPGLAFDLHTHDQGQLSLRWVNPALQRLLEFEEGDGDVCRYIFAEDESKAQGFARDLRAGQRIDGEIRIVTPSQGVRWIRFWAQPVARAGVNERVYGAAEDVTALHHATDDLRSTHDRLRSLMRGLPGTISRVSRDLRYLEVNEQLAALFDLSPGEFINQPIDFLGAGHTLEAFLREFFAGDEEQATCDLAPSIGGVARHLMVVAHKYDNGDAAHLIGIDLTAQRAAEGEARTKDRLHRALVETAPEAILVVDLDKGRIVQANQNAGALLGRATESLLGQPLDIISPPWQPGGIVSADRLTMLLQQASQHALTEEWTCRDAEGGDIVCELRLSPLSQAPPLIRCSLRDLTEQHRRERELVAAREQAEAMMQLRASFLSNMSHEFRTPLTGIIGFSALLAESAQDEQREMVSVIERSGTRLLRLLNGILDLATLEAGIMEVRAADLDVGREVREAIRLHAAAADEKGLVVKLNMPERSARAILDPTLFQRVMASLLDNAIRFTEMGGVEVTLSERDGGVHIAVRDSGIGISPSFLPFIFEGFSQESTGIARTHEGSGLGLAITRGLVELMEGTIDVESVRGAGATFTVTFPSVEGEPQIAPVNDDRQGQRGGEVGAEDASEARVLAVEDSADAQRMLHYALGPHYRLDAVASETDALRLAQLHAYDLVLMDVNLGAKRDGVDVLNALRDLSGYENTPILAVTAYAMPGDRERFLRCGFDGYLGKPFTTARVQEVVQETLAARSG
ncbi:MAG: ATP-binding protein [Bacteroidota bacterium]